MKVNSITIDNFYEDPMEVREFALKQEFKVRGNHPGQRTISFLDESVKQKLKDILSPFAGNITDWGGIHSGSFQYTVSTDRSWIHFDGLSNWAAVCYLTPNAPVTSGTGIFKHRETGWTNFDYNRINDSEYLKQAPSQNESNDYSKWEMIDRIGNVFNRLVLYRADNFHVSLDYFGNNMYDGRLFQVFFLKTEK